MKKLISVILVLCMAVLVIPFSAAAETPTDQQQYIKDMGYESDTSWIEIASAEAFAKIGVDENYPLTGKYYVTANITPKTDASLITVESFKGIIDGCGYTVKAPAGNITVNQVLMNKSATGAVVKNLNFGSSDARIEMSCKANVGVVAGTVSGKTTIDNVNVYATIDDNNRGASPNQMGGLVGKADGALIITNSSFDGLLCTNNNPAENKDGNAKYFGGLVGSNTAGTTFISNSKANVKTGQTEGTDKIVSPSSFGGIIGRVTKGAVISNCVATGDASVYVGEGDNKVCTLNFDMTNGASIRYSEPTGMRFETNVNTAQLAAVKEKYDTTNSGGYGKFKMGTLIAPTAYVTDAGAITKEALDEYKTRKGISTATYLDVAYESDNYFAISGDNSTFTGAIASIKDNSMSFTAVSYIALNLSSVEEIWVYLYAPTTVTKTVKEIAQSAFNENDYAGDAEKKQILEDLGAVAS